jgi:hypothetical protein
LNLSRQNSTSRNRDETTNPLLPELEIGLAYDKNQSILFLEIGKGINFGMTSQGRPPGIYFILSNLLKLFDFFFKIRVFK